MKKIIRTLFAILLLAGCTIRSISVSAPILEESAPKQVHISLMAVGDNLIHKPIYNEAQQRANGNGFNFLPAYAPMSNYIKNADIAFINHEVPLGGSQLGLSSYPLFNSPQELGDDLIKLGFNVVNHATNHILDKGEKGIQNTINYWKDKEGVLVLGINDGTLPKVRCLEIDGIKFSFLSYTYGTNGITLPKNSSFSVSYIDKEKIASDIKKAKEISDVTIVSMHWGTEYSTSVDNMQKQLAKLLADENVDLVIGHHPHAIGPIEAIKRPDGKDMIVAYSLGNFISSQNKALSMLGGMLNVDFKGTKGNISAVNPKFIPLVTHYEGFYKNTTVYPLNAYTRELAAKHGCKAFDKNFSYDYLINLVQKVINPIYIDTKIK